MIITHASAEKIERVTNRSIYSTTQLGCLFFADEGNTYNLANNCRYQYNLDIDENNILELHRVQYEHSHEDEVVAAILEQFAAAVDLDTDELGLETIFNILDESEDIYDYAEQDDGEKSWIMQQFQGILAHKLGYDACESEDEQGCVYIVYCVDKQLDEVDCTKN